MLALYTPFPKIVLSSRIDQVFIEGMTTLWLFINRYTAQRLLSVLCFILVITMHITMIHAQNNKFGGGAQGSAQNYIGQKWKVMVNVGYIYAGPSSVYRKLGQVYQNEMLEIVDVTPSQEWIRVLSTNGVKGWINASNLEKSKQKLSPGRYRRQNNYQYDARGNRIQPNGKAVGKGQLNDRRFDTQNRSRQDRSDQRDQDRSRQNQRYQDSSRQDQRYQNRRTQEYSGDRSQKEWHNYKFMVSLSPVGIQSIYRQFSSDIVAPSPLASFKSDALAYQYQVELLYKAHRYFHIQSTFLNTAGGSTQLPAHPLYDAISSSELTVSQTQVELHLQGGYQVKSIWFGLSAGGHYFDQSYRQIAYPKPYNTYSTLQNHEAISLSTGGIIKLEMNRFRLVSDLALLLPLSFEQTPNSEGTWEGLGWRAHLKASVVINQLIAVGVYARYMRLGVELTGPAAYSDPFDKKYPRYYTKASMMESGLGGGLSIDFTF
jgi:hypothetical protein